MGLIAALMCAVAINAQEITNTDWPNPNTVPFDKPATTTAGQAAAATSGQNAGAAAIAVAESSSVNQPKLSGEAGFILGALSVCTILAMYMFANQRVRKARRLQDSSLGSR